MKIPLKTSITALVAFALLLGTAQPALAVADEPPIDDRTESLVVTESQPTKPGADTDGYSSQSATKSTAAVSPYMLPLPSKSYRISSHFGNRCPSKVGANVYHGATDMAAPDGTPIYAMMAGTVTKITEPVNSTTSGAIHVDHGIVNGKKVVSVYVHPWEPSKYVKLGQKVAKGQQIAEVGSSGISSGPHLHLAVSLDGVWVDPLIYFKGTGLDIEAGATKVAKRTEVTSCTVYTHGIIGLKAKALNTSDTLVALPNATKITMTPMRPEKGYVKVTVAGKTGYIPSNMVGPAPRVADPVLPKLGATDKGFTYGLRAGRIQHFRDFPSLVLGESGIIDTVTTGDLLVSTGRTISGTSWQEFNFAGRTGWAMVNSGFYITNAIPQGLTKDSTLTNKTKKLNSTVLYLQPTTNKFAVNNKKTAFKSGQNVTTTGHTYGNWAEVKVSKKLYWVPKSTLSNPKPVAKPSIKAGDVVAKDRAGNLWNYSNLAGKPAARKLISTGWKNAKSVNVTDFNGDGTLDIVANFTDGKLYLYAGKRTGGFAARTVLSSKGWSTSEVHAVKMRKTDKYPSIVTRTASGKLNLYKNTTGKSLAAAKTIGSGWQKFSHVSFVYYDNNNAVDVLAQNKAGKVLLYRTNGSKFYSESRKTVRSGWASLRPTTGVAHHGAKSTGLMAVRSDGKLLYYGLSGSSKWNAAKVVGSGWTSLTLARGSL